MPATDYTRQLPVHQLPHQYHNYRISALIYLAWMGSLRELLAVARAPPPDDILRVRNLSSLRCVLHLRNDHLSEQRPLYVSCGCSERQATRVMIKCVMM